MSKALTSGPARVTIIGGPAKRLAVAERWGATATIDITATSPDERRDTVMASTNGRGADVVIEMSGSPQAFAEGMGLLRSGGRYLIVGQVHGRSVPFNPSSIVLKHAQLIGTLSGSVAHYARGLEFIDHHRDRFRWSDMISNHYRLDNINDAFLGMQALTEIKPAIDFSAR